MVRPRRERSGDGCSRRRGAWPLALALAGVLLTGACAKGSDGPEVASLRANPGDIPAAAATPSTAAAAGDRTDQLRQFAQCMRDKGVDVKDPQPGRRARRHRRHGRRDRPQRPARHPGVPGVPVQAAQRRPAARGSTPQQVEIFRQFAQCVRDHGVDLPDPTADGGLQAPTGGLAALQSPAFQAALVACRDKLTGILPSPSPIVKNRVDRHADSPTSAGEPGPTTSRPCAPAPSHPGDRGRGRGRGRRRGGRVAAFGIDFSSASPASTIRLPPATGKVTRMTLTETEKVNGTLGYGDAHPVTVRGTGTVTWLPAAGATVQRGQPVFRRDDVPVPLFYGAPAVLPGPAQRGLRRRRPGAGAEPGRARVHRLHRRLRLTPRHRRRGPQWQADLGLDPDRRLRPDLGRAGPGRDPGRRRSRPTVGDPATGPLLT